MIKLVASLGILFVIQTVFVLPSCHKPQCAGFVNETVRVCLSLNMKSRNIEFRASWIGPIAECSFHLPLLGIRNAA